MGINDLSAPPWQALPLNAIAKTTSGGTPDRKAERYFGGGIPWVKSGELNDRHILSTEETITNDGLKNSSAKLLEPGTLLIAMYGATVGRTAILKIKAATNQAVCAIFPDTNVIDSEFLQYFLINQREALLKQRYGGAQPNISQNILRNMLVSFPPLPEQKKIAEVVGLIQTAIEQQQRLQALTAELKQALLHQLFTTGLHGEPQKETEIGRVPESWDIVPCEALCDMVTVGVVVRPASYYVPKGIPAFRSQNVREDRLEVDELVYFSAEDNNDKLSKSKLRCGDILIVRTGYPGTSCVVPSEYEGANCIDVVIARPNSSVARSGFLSRFFNSPAGRRQTVAAKHGLHSNTLM